jgi:2-polyprenyl-6-methoxyphenol hydroxylase-like FAD-dependent oxidoreductase
VSIITLPCDNATWTVAFIGSSRDHALRALRDPAHWDAALVRYPLAAAWRDGEPITGIEVLAGLEDRHHSYSATGVVAVGDAAFCTNPSLGRGASIGLVHARTLRDLLRETGTDEPDKLVRRFAERSAATVEPLYRATL